MGVSAICPKISSWQWQKMLAALFPHPDLVFLAPPRPPTRSLARAPLSGQRVVRLLLFPSERVMSAEGASSE